MIDGKVKYLGFLLGLGLALYVLVFGLVWLLVRINLLEAGVLTLGGPFTAIYFALLLILLVVKSLKSKRRDGL